jgi:hypothetical protein
MNEREIPLSTEILLEWRNNGTITREEVVFKSGDLFVAENVITKTRRIITPKIIETIANRRVLKG